MKKLLFLIPIIALAFTPQSIMPNKVILTPKQKAMPVAAAMVKGNAVLPPPPAATVTLIWNPVTQQGLSITNYEVWSTTNLQAVPMAFETSTQSTNAVMPKNTWNKNYDVRAVNSFGLKSNL